MNKFLLLLPVKNVDQSILMDCLTAYSGSSSDKHSEIEPYPINYNDISEDDFANICAKVDNIDNNIVGIIVYGDIPSQKFLKKLNDSNRCNVPVITVANVSPFPDNVNFAFRMWFDIASLCHSITDQMINNTNINQNNLFLFYNNNDYGVHIRDELERLLNIEKTNEFSYDDYTNINTIPDLNKSEGIILIGFGEKYDELLSMINQNYNGIVFTDNYITYKHLKCENLKICGLSIDHNMPVLDYHELKRELEEKINISLPLQITTSFLEIEPPIFFAPKEAVQFFNELLNGCDKSSVEEKRKYIIEKISEKQFRKFSLGSAIIHPLGETRINLNYRWIGKIKEDLFKENQYYSSQESVSMFLGQVESILDQWRPSKEFPTKLLNQIFDILHNYLGIDQAIIDNLSNHDISQYVYNYNSCHEQLKILSSVFYLFKKCIPLQFNGLKRTLADNDVLNTYFVLDNNIIMSINNIIDSNREDSVCGIVMSKTRNIAKYLWNNREKKDNVDKILDKIREENGIVFSLQEKSESQNVISNKEIFNDIINACIGINKNIKGKGFEYIIPEVLSRNVNSAEESHLIYLAFKSERKLSCLELFALISISSRIFALAHIAENWYINEIANTKSALSAIMSRNGSHNIGSHVLAMLSHNVGTMPDDRKLYQYIQHRMDYIATVTTDFPTWTLSTKLVAGIIKGFLEQRHLLEYISKSEGLQAFRFQDQNNTGKDWYKQENTIQIHVKRTGSDIPNNNGPICFIEYPDDFPEVESETAAENYRDIRLKYIEKARKQLDFDLDVAIPGGVIGQHAFYTILENTIRNSAKHGWAIYDSSQIQDETQKRPDNLKIWIDFSRDEDGRNITLKIYDNISNIFKKPKFKEPEKEKAWNIIEKHQNSLIEPLTTEQAKAINEFLNDKSDELPSPYNNLYEDLKENDNWKLLKDYLTGKTSDTSKIGHRIWMPLHHRQQVKLAKSFLDDSGKLRRENWGLAEMKISAGYLQMRSLAEIGGISDSLEDNKAKTEILGEIITPIAIKDGDIFRLGHTFKIRCPREICFVIRMSEISEEERKNVMNQSNELFKDLQRRGVYIVIINDLNNKNEIDEKYYEMVFKHGQQSLLWDYRYVILPSLPKMHDPFLPFRILSRETLAGKTQDGHTFVDIIPVFSDYDNYRDRLVELINKSNKDSVNIFIREIKQSIYKTWCYYWKNIRRTDIPEVDMCVNVLPEGNSKKKEKEGAERCLISDADVWKLVLDEEFRAFVRRIVQKELEPPPTSNNPEDDETLVLKEYLVILAILKKKGVTKFDDQRKRVSMMAQLTSWFDEEFKDITIEDRKKWFDEHITELKEFVESCNDKDAMVKNLKFDFENEEKQNWIFELNENIKAWVDKCYKDTTETLQKTVPTMYDGDDEPGIRKAMLELTDVFEYVNVLVRKYEERIMTLPESFKPKPKNASQSLNVKNYAKGIGIDLVLPPETTSKKTINYIRHFIPSAFDAESMEYAEPLSGTQSYLNALGSIISSTQNETQMESEQERAQSFLSLMYENALSRILIVDERTADFVEKHSKISEIFAQMGIWVFDHNSWLESVPEKANEKMELTGQSSSTEIKSSYLKSKALLNDNNLNLSSVLLNPKSENLFADFDILIIHQGLIDKWLPGIAKNEESMNIFLNDLKRIFPYVVITTGRGTPANTPKTARILPFSVVEETLFRSSPEKLILMEAIMNILPRGDKNV